MALRHFKCELFRTCSLKILIVFIGDMNVGHKVFRPQVEQKVRKGSWAFYFFQGECSHLTRYWHVIAIVVVGGAAAIGVKNSTYNPLISILVGNLHLCSPRGVFHKDIE